MLIIGSIFFSVRTAPQNRHRFKTGDNTVGGLHMSEKNRLPEQKTDQRKQHCDQKDNTQQNQTSDMQYLSG